MTSAKTPIQKALEANEQIADLAHRCDVLRGERDVARGQRDFARRMAGVAGFVALVLAGLLLSGCASADEGTIYRDMGGSVAAYSMKYHDWDKRGVRARIVGVCGSACTLALRNKDMCYAPNATFLFHGVSMRGEYDARASAEFRDAMPEGVRQWADSTGAFNSTEVVSISGRELAAYDGRVCG